MLRNILTVLFVLALGGTIAHAQQVGITGNATVNGQLIVPNSTASTSPTTGALQVTGGAGISGSVYVGNNLSVTLASAIGVSGGSYAAAEELGHDQGGSGNWFGNNPYCWIDSPTGAGTECVAEEDDTDVRATSNVIAKVGLQVTSVATDAGHGSTIDAGILLGQKTGGVGYNIGLQIGTSSQNPIDNTGTGIEIQQTAMDTGLDLSHTTFGIDAVLGPGHMLVDPAGNVAATGYYAWTGSINQAGVSCAPGAPSTLFQTYGGIVVHC